MPGPRQNPDSSGVIGDSIERLRHDLGDYVTARAQHLVRGAGHTVEQLAGRIAGAPAAAPRDAVKRATTDPVQAGGHLLRKAAVEPAENAVPGLGGQSGSGSGKAGTSGGKTTTIIKTIDVGVPLTSCYNHWTTYAAFGGFMKGVQHVRRTSDTETDWRLKVGPSTRSWTATVQQQAADQRAEWTSEGDKGTTTGAIFFYELAPRLTRIVVVVEYSPAGFLERTANLWRAQGRRLRLDLRRFQSHVTLAAAEDEPEGWRGEIEDADIVRDHADVTQHEEEEARAADAEEEEYEDDDEEYEYEYEYEYEDDDDADAEEYEDDDEDDAQDGDVDDAQVNRGGRR